MFFCSLFLLRIDLRMTAVIHGFFSSCGNPLFQQFYMHDKI